ASSTQTPVHPLFYRSAWGKQARFCSSTEREGEHTVASRSGYFNRRRAPIDEDVVIGPRLVVMVEVPQVIKVGIDPPMAEILQGIAVAIRIAEALERCLVKAVPVGPECPLGHESRKGPVETVLQFF